MNFHIHHYHHPDDETKQLLNELLSILLKNQTILKEIQVTDQQVSDILDQVNATTNGIAVVQQADAKTLNTVKTELEALLGTVGQPGGISDATASKLTALAAAIGQVQGNTESNSLLLNAIAAEGANTTQIPSPPPPPANP